MEDPNFLVDVGSDKRAGRALWEMGIRKKYKIAQVSFGPTVRRYQVEQGAVEEDTSGAKPGAENAFA
jgi:hypothetical protein